MWRESVRISSSRQKQGEGQVVDEERELWQAGEVRCLMISCCTGAELQVRRGEEIVLRELYPTKSDLYERARELKAERDSHIAQTP
jgi:hypothetical protein